MNTTFDVESRKAEDKRTLEELILKKFPKRVLELNALLEIDKLRVDFDVTEDLNISQTPSKTEMSEEGLAIKQECLDQSDPNPSAIVHKNRHLAELTELVRPLMEEFIQDVSKVHVGVVLMVPQIEDGNNFGVEVQEEVLEVIRNALKDICLRITEINKYYNARADLVVDVLKYPNVEDCRRAVRERDITFHRILRMCVILLRNQYAILNDMIEKNLNKIKKPKSSAKHMY